MKNCFSHTMREPLYNQRFDDIYFSPQDGLAETRHVFLDGNDLPQSWQGRNHFTIVETGFGTGLNFLAAVKAFQATASDHQVLDFISFEKYPLDRDTIRNVLSYWQNDIGDLLTQMLAVYPLRIAGFHRIQFAANIRLTLIFDDINAAMPQLSVPCGVDAWFLDGFAPSKNPDMWGDALFEGIKRLSAPHSSIATFTAAGFVKRAIADTGFEVRKMPGFGRKREMITARKQTAQSATVSPVPKSVAVIGGGLAGTSAAYVLKQYGISPTIYEASDTLAAGASGNMAGLYNPRFTAQRQPESDYFAGAYALAYRQFGVLQERYDIGFNPCGALHLVNSPEKEKRYKSLCENWDWHEDHACMVSAAEASELSGLSLDHAALYLPESGVVCPAELCAAYAEGIETVLNIHAEPVLKDADWMVDGRYFDAVILACGVGVKALCGLDWLPLHGVRGQVTQCSVTGKRPQIALCYGGYTAPMGDNEVICGSTFQKWRDDTLLSSEDDVDNLQKLFEVQPALKGRLTVKGARAGLRAATQDHWPLVGMVPDYDAWQKGVQKDDDAFLTGLYISAGHGSHGILSSLMAAHLIADSIVAGSSSVSLSSAEAVNPARFLKRWRKKNKL